MSEKFGPRSKEARVAWDIVEEIDASDNMRYVTLIITSFLSFVPPSNTSQYLMQLDFTTSRQAFDLDKSDDITAAGLPQIEKEYVHSVNSLADILSNVIEPAIGPIKTLILNIQNAEKDDPKLSELGGPLPEVLANLLSEAKAADDIYGPSSSKSTDAWHRAEDLAVDIDISGVKSSDSPELPNDTDLRYKEAAVTSHHDYFTVVDPSFLEEAMEALVKLEHFTSLVVIEKNRLHHSLKKAGDDYSAKAARKKQP